MVCFCIHTGSRVFLCSLDGWKWKFLTGWCSLSSNSSVSCACWRRVFMFLVCFQVGDTWMTKNKRIPRRACLWGPLDALRLEGKRGVSVRGVWDGMGITGRSSSGYPQANHRFMLFLIRSEPFVGEDVLFWRYWWSKYAPSENEQASLTLRFFRAFQLLYLLHN